jgi:type I restriction enzyme S subunit
MAKIDALVDEQTRLIELLKEKRQAVISHTVTKGLDPNAPMKRSGVEWIGEMPARWGLGKLGRLVSTRKGIAFKAEDFSEQGVTVVRASDIKNLTIKRSETYLPPHYLAQYPQAILKADEIILSTVGSTPDVKNSAVGQLGQVPVELSGSLLNQNTVVFSLSTETFVSGFLFLVLQTTGYRDHLDLNAHGTANQASLNVLDMLNFTVPLPSLMEQNLIVAFLGEKLAKMDALAEDAQRAIYLLQERRGALVAAAVTGKIDVRGFGEVERVKDNNTSKDKAVAA